jgi:hypothetical protein
VARLLIVALLAGCPRNGCRPDYASPSDFACSPAAAPCPDLAEPIFSCCQMAKACTFDQEFTCKMPDGTTQTVCFCEPHVDFPLHCHGYPQQCIDDLGVADLADGGSQG